jgi:hypothetical protein
VTQTLNRNAKVHAYCTFLPTRHPALTPSPCQLQLDCCSQSRIDQKLLRAADKNSISRGKKSSEIAVQQSSLKCQVEQPQTPYHTLRNSGEGAAFPRTTSTRPPWHRNPETENEQAKMRLSSWGLKKSYEAHPSRRRCKQGCTTSASENSKNSGSGAGQMSENRTLVARAEEARLRKDLASR